MPVAPFIPLIAQGAGAVAGHFGGKQAERNALKRTPEEMLALGGAQGAAGTLGRSGRAMLGQAQPWLGQTGNYYQTLLRGNRAAQAQAIAAPAAQLTDLYRGAERGLTRSGLQGAQRETAAADLARDRASRMAGLVTGVQPMAAAALGQLGTNVGQLGGSLAGQAGGIYQNLLGAGAENRGYARGEGAATAKAIGQLSADIGGVLSKRFPGKPNGGGGDGWYDDWKGTENVTFGK